MIIGSDLSMAGAWLPVLHSTHHALSIMFALSIEAYLPVCHSFLQRRHATSIWKHFH